MRSLLLISAAAALFGCAASPHASRTVEPAQVAAAAAAAAALPVPADLNAGPPPEQLDKAAIVAGMSRLKPVFVSCFQPGSAFGVWTVTFTILNTGRVHVLKVTAPGRDEATFACLVAVASEAIFPRFTGEPHTINYPLVFR